MKQKPEFEYIKDERLRWGIKPFIYGDGEIGYALMLFYRKRLRGTIYCNLKELKNLQKFMKKREFEE